MSARLSHEALGGRVVVAEDERALAQMVVAYLERAGFMARQVHTGPEALKSVRETEPDVLVLDLGLPGLDGIEVCRRVRSMSGCYVLILTARGSENDRLLGLEAGADDYIIKPFSVRELVARVRAVLRRPRLSAPVQQHVCGDLTVDFSGHEVRVANEVVVVTRTEFDLLATLSASPQEAFTRRQLIDAVWDTSWVGDERIVDVHIGNLRRKLKDASGGEDYIDTVRSIGYRMVQR